LSLWKDSGISERHTLLKPEQTTNKEWIDKWEILKNELGKGIIIMIIGNRGAGKTQLASCAIRESCKMLRPSKYIKALSFFLEVRKTYKNNSERSEHDVIREFTRPQLLVIDAIENRSDTPFENLLLNHLIDLRYDAMKDTIVIGNLTEAEFAASVGVSIVDRIYEGGIKIVCQWKSFRKS
jgi:DNA replication protein DnaC